MIGRPFLEYFREEVKTALEVEAVAFQEDGDHLLLKVPFNLPYQSTSYNFDSGEDLIIYRGDFYRTTSRVFENDTLYTMLRKETPDRGNILEMMSQVSKNYDKKPVDPVQDVIKLLKNFSNSYHTVSVTYYTFFWTDWLRFDHNEPVSLYHSQERLISSPPPRC